MKLLLKTLFAVYLLLLLWLVLFKFSYDPLSVLREHQARSVNLVPFAHARTNEMIANLFVFIPFGVLIGVGFKAGAFRYKLAAILAFSLSVEIMQYALAIGVTDITDLIMNTLGGLIGLTAYKVLSTGMNPAYLERSIAVIGVLIVLVMVYLRVFVFVVRY